MVDLECHNSTLLAIAGIIRTLKTPLCPAHDSNICDNMVVLVSTHWHAHSHIDAESDTIVCTLPPTLHATERLMPMVRSCGGVGIASTMISYRLWAANLKHDTLLPGPKA